MYLLGLGNQMLKIGEKIFGADSPFYSKLSEAVSYLKEQGESIQRDITQHGLTDRIANNAADYIEKYYNFVRVISGIFEYCGEVTVKTEFGNWINSKSPTQYEIAGAPVKYFPQLAEMLRKRQKLYEAKNVIEKEIQKMEQLNKDGRLDKLGQKYLEEYKQTMEK
jgi:predicted DNA-binding protein (UPF0278 family)